MPQRLLKPGLTHSERWNRCSWPAQSLFIRLLNLVDDYARTDANVTLLASIAFPFGHPNGRRVTPDHVNTWLAELERADMLVRYSVNGGSYLQLNRWTERCRANSSRFPGPVAVNCQQMPSSVGDCQQSAANAALPSTTSTSTSTTAPVRERERDSSRVEQSKLRWGAVNRRIAELSSKPRVELTSGEREELRDLKKTRADIEAQQREGKFK